MLVKAETECIAIARANLIQYTALPCKVYSILLLLGGFPSHIDRVDFSPDYWIVAICGRIMISAVEQSLTPSPTHLDVISPGHLHELRLNRMGHSHLSCS